jgi:hypothetical protein
LESPFQGRWLLCDHPRSIRNRRSYACDLRRRWIMSRPKPCCWKWPRRGSSWQDKRGLPIVVSPEVLLSLRVNSSALLAQFLELGCWRASARLPPRVVFLREEGPANSRRCTTALNQKWKSVLVDVAEKLTHAPQQRHARLRAAQRMIAPIDSCPACSTPLSYHSPPESRPD